jgi:hypothetical protein
MTTKKDSLRPYVTAIQSIREAEREQGTREQQEECLPIADLMFAAWEQASPEVNAQIEAHTANCIYCRLTLQSLKDMASRTPLPDLPDNFEDPVGQWAISDEPVTRKPQGEGPTVLPPQRLTAKDSPPKLVQGQADPEAGPPNKPTLTWRSRDGRLAWLPVSQPVGSDSFELELQANSQLDGNSVRLGDAETTITNGKARFRIADLREGNLRLFIGGQEWNRE